MESTSTSFVAKAAPTITFGKIHTDTVEVKPPIEVSQAELDKVEAEGQVMVEFPDGYTAFTGDGSNLQSECDPQPCWLILEKNSVV